MPLIIALLLLLIVGGPWLVGVVLALTGVWFVFVLTLAAVLGVCIVVAVVLIVTGGMVFSRKGPQKSAFGMPLDEKFKMSNGVEPGIWKDDMHYLVELNGRTNYFRTLAEARAARDTGVVK